MSNKDIEYTTVSEVAGPLMIVEGIKDVAYNEVVKIKTSFGEERTGTVLEAFMDKAVELTKDKEGGSFYPRIGNMVFRYFRFNDFQETFLR